MRAAVMPLVAALICAFVLAALLLRGHVSACAGLPAGSIVRLLNCPEPRP
jgi:hypothetical protein